MLWSEFLDVARRLAVGTSEGDWRSAVSRAYYAAYHYFVDWLQSNGIGLPASGQTHQYVYQGLNNSGIPALVPVANVFYDLQKLRGIADYELTTSVSQQQADDAVRGVDAMVTAFETLLTTISAATVAAGIRAYLVASGRIRP